MMPDGGLARVLSAAIFSVAAFVAAAGATELRQGLADLRRLRRELLIAPQAAAAAACTTAPSRPARRLFRCGLDLEWRSGGSWTSVCPQVGDATRFAIERPYRVRFSCERPRHLEIATVVVR